MGTNAKVMMQFDGDRRIRRVERLHGHRPPVPVTWECPRGSRQRRALTTYFGGRTGAGGLPATAHGPDPRAERDTHSRR